MCDLANRGVNVWANAHNVATEDSPFWDEVASDLQDHETFRGDPNEITGDDLRQEFDAVLKGLLGTPPDKSERFSGHQRLMIVCIGYDINVTQPELPDDFWSNYNDDELGELVVVLSNSALFLPDGVNSSLLKVWLADLERLFA
jgi:hypothetical protein